MAIVYIYRRIDINDDFKNVFYVGIGKKEQRAYQINHHSRSKLLKNILSKVEFKIEITHKDISWEEACSIESYLIEFYGRRDLNKGNLCNHTSGGEGTLGYKFTEAQKSNLLSSLKNRDFSHLRELGYAMRGVPLPDSVKEKIRKANIGKILSEEHKLKISKSNTGKKRTDITKKNISLSKKGRKISESQKEILKKYSFDWTGKKHTDERKNNWSIIRKGRVLSEETKMKMKIAQKNRWDKIKNIT